MLLGIDGKLDHAFEEMVGRKTGKVVVNQLLYIRRQI